jgi:outer membrane lipoprotein-sorting protein
MDKFKTRIPCGCQYVDIIEGGGYRWVLCKEHSDKYLSSKKSEEIIVSNDDMFYFVDYNGKEVFKTENKYDAYMFAAELKLKSKNG